MTTAGIDAMFTGIRIDGRTSVVVIRDGKATPLPHRVRHSPTGFEWGYDGSGPADLALAIVHNFLGYEPAPMIYQEFKRRIVARFDRDVFELPVSKVLETLDAIKRDTSTACFRCADRGIAGKRFQYCSCAIGQRMKAEDESGNEVKGAVGE